MEQRLFDAVQSVGKELTDAISSPVAARREHVHVYPGGQAIVGAVSNRHTERGGLDEKKTNPMERSTREPLPLRLAPRCLAQTRSGTPCQKPAAKGKKRCRLHGGAKGSGAP
jgi:hypothetical protein